MYQLPEYGEPSAHTDNRYLERYAAQTYKILKQKQYQQFIDALLQIPKKIYYKFSVFFETTAGKSLFSVLQKSFSGEENIQNLYTILVFSEFKTDRQMGVALILNELIKEQNANEIATIACLSRLKNIQQCFMKYGSLYDLLKGHQALVTVWQVRADFKQQ